MKDKFADMDRRSLIFMAAVLVLLLIQLNYQNQLWTAQDGSVLFWTSDAWGPGSSQHFWDPYTFTHMLHGVVFCGIICLIAPALNWGWKFAISVAAEAAWEMLENTDFVVDKYRETTASTEYLGDTILNSYGDILACSIGFLIAYALGWWRSLILYVVVEIFLILWVRDSLTINIIMLIYPIEAIKNWQMGHG